MKDTLRIARDVALRLDERLHVENNRRTAEEALGRLDCATVFLEKSEPKLPFNACEPDYARLYAVGACVATVATVAACSKVIAGISRNLVDGELACKRLVDAAAGKKFDLGKLLRDIAVNSS